jgi:hypothetical protein
MTKGDLIEFVKSFGDLNDKVTNLYIRLSILKQCLESDFKKRSNKSLFSQNEMRWLIEEAGIEIQNAYLEFKRDKKLDFLC